LKPETSGQTLGSIAILGLGLIGGSVGLALRGRNTAGAVVGWDPSTANGRKALDRGAVDSLAGSAQEAVTRADLVLLSPPLPATIPLLEAICAALPTTATVTDVGSLKAAISTEADRILPGQFVGGHPMAGSETGGIESSRPDLFLRAPWLLTPTGQTLPEIVRKAELLAREVGARPRVCDPVEHDRIVATLSHLPHLLAYGLARTAADLVSDEWRDIAAGSFRDGTRVAASDPSLWNVVFRDNQEALLTSLDRFESWIASIRQAIGDRDDERLRDLLRSAHQAKASFAVSPTERNTTED
jgi:prephenate dehydrogenase